MIERFFKREKEYEAWFQRNNGGFILNYFGGTDLHSVMNKLHKADCPYLWRKSDEGKRTTAYEKVCSNELEDLLGFIKGKRDKSWEPCKFCKPLYKEKERLT